MMPIPVAALDAGGKAVAWLWDKYGKDLVDKAREDFKKKWTEVQWVEAAQKYRVRMLELHGTLRVIGKPEPVSLEGVFTDVFILDRPNAFRRFDMARLRENPDLLSDRQTKRVSGLRLVTQSEAHRLFILGPPGAGKTTFLKYLALQAAQGKLDKIPIFVGLNEWSESGLELLPFIERQFAICAFPDARAFIEHILEAGDALVLFDGLDEVRQAGEQRAKVVKVIRDFSNQYLKSQVLVTCRVAATEYELSDKFTYVELADFTENQMRAYARKWFSDDPKKGDAFEKELFEKSGHRGLQEMGQTPLLLAILCLSFEEMLKFPQNRAELYKQALDALFKRWDKTRMIRRDEGEIYRKLSPTHKRRILATIAWEGFEQNEIFFRQEDLERTIVTYLSHPDVGVDEDIDGEDVLKAIEAQHGILVERAHRIHAFAHLSFQEYFTAKYVVENNALSRLLTLERIRDRRWREVFLLTASLFYTADNFFGRFHSALDATVCEDTGLLAILQWADTKARPFVGAHKTAALRALYVCLARARNSALDRVRDRVRALDRDFASLFALDFASLRALDVASLLDRDSAGALANALANDFSLASDFASALDRDSAFDLARARARARVLNLDRDLDRTLDHVRARARDRTAHPPGLILDICLMNTLYLAHIFSAARKIELVAERVAVFTAYLRDLVSLARRAEEPALAAALAALHVPALAAPQAVWDTFVQASNTLLAHRDLHHDFGLSEAQVKKLTDYLEANSLLIECLNLASVSDRAGIEARILQPPEDHHG